MCHAPGGTHPRAAPAAARAAGRSTARTRRPLGVVSPPADHIPRHLSRFAPPAAALPGQSDPPVWSRRRGIASLLAVDRHDMLRWPSLRVCRRQLGFVCRVHLHISTLLCYRSAIAFKATG
ncbi:hypothetical protein ACP4OV_006552 [Aristida adscensionis]